MRGGCVNVELQLKLKISECCSAHVRGRPHCIGTVLAYFWQSFWWRVR